MQPCRTEETCAFLTEPVCESLRSGLIEGTFTFDKLEDNFQCASGKFCCQEKPRHIVPGECESGIRAVFKYSANATDAFKCLDNCEAIEGNIYRLTEI